MNRFTIDADFISLAGLDDNVDLLLDVLMVLHKTTNLGYA